MLEFNRNFSPEYGKIIQVSPLIRRLVADNPSPFTFYGTGTYIVGRDRVAIIDPGPDLASHIDALAKFSEKVEISHILVTHNHADHSPAAQPLKQITGAEIYAFDVGGQAEIDDPSEEGRDRNFRPDHILKDGDRVEGEGWTLQALHTPGHLSNHLCFALPQEKALFTGDHVMVWSTSVVSQPDGDMAAYLASLEMLLGRNDEVYYPTHGAPIENPKPFVKELIAHRHEREDQILATIEAGATTIGKMVEIIYRDIPPYLHPAAASSVLSHLIHMIAKGQVNCQGDVDYAGIFSITQRD